MSFAKAFSCHLPPLRAFAKWMPTKILTSKEVLENEDRIRRPLGETAHQVRIPFRAERDVHAHAPSIANELLLQIAADAVQHLKLERVGSDVLAPREGDRRVDHLRIVRRDSVIRPAPQHDLHQLDEVRVDIRLRLESDLRRLLVRALAEADADAL